MSATTYPIGPGVIPGFGTVITANPLAEGFQPPAAPEAGRVVLYSGWLGQQLRPGVWASSFETWGPKGRDVFNALIDRLANAEKLVGVVWVCFRPHARHVLADPQTCLSFLRSHETKPDRRFELLLDPVAFLTPDMLGQAEDHLRRAFGALADRPDVPGLLLTNAELIEAGDSKELRACPLKAGVLDAEMLNALAKEFWPIGKPVFELSVEEQD